MSPSIEAFNEAKYKALMDGLECAEIMFSGIDLGDRIDSDFFTKEYLEITSKLEGVKTNKLGSLATVVASAFYPAATQLYSIGDTPFIRCVDCIDYPIITNEQDQRFEKLPIRFANENKGLATISKGDMIITKVGTPCYTSVLEDYANVILSRTVLGLTKIQTVSPYYLMSFLRCKYGFSQLYRHRELTIQYQLTLSRVKSVDVYMASEALQQRVTNLCREYIQNMNNSKQLYQYAEQLLMEKIGLTVNELPNQSITVITLKESFEKSGRLDSEYYYPKYSALISIIQKQSWKTLGKLVKIKKSIEPGSDAYTDSGIPFVRVSDITKFGISSPEIYLSENVVPNVESLFPTKDTILFSKDGTVGIAYKMEKTDRLITSGALLHLTIQNTEIVLPDYLTLVLNSPIVQLQAERDSNGAIIQHWKPSEIESVMIPVLGMMEQLMLAEKVQQSFELRTRAESLLDMAKQTIELAIEQGEEAAIQWLNGKEAE